MSIKTGILESVKSDVESIGDTLTEINTTLTNSAVDSSTKEATNENFLSVLSGLGKILKKVELHLSLVTDESIENSDIID